MSVVAIKQSQIVKVTIMIAIQLAERIQNTNLNRALRRQYLVFWKWFERETVIP